MKAFQAFVPRPKIKFLELVLTESQKYLSMGNALCPEKQILIQNTYLDF
jgi:hypothetical protein